MKHLLTPDEMYALEKLHFASGMSSLDAMERAATAVADDLSLHAEPLRGKRVYVACGSGNNGGDGYAIARLIGHMDANVSIVALTDVNDLRGDAQTNARRALQMGLERLAPREAADKPAPDIWVDALFGIGLNRIVEGDALGVIRLINAHRKKGSYVISVDVPSGLDARRGFPMKEAVMANRTVTFQYPKTGHLLLDGPDFCGELAVHDIGLTAFPPPAVAARLVEPMDPARFFPPRPRNTHKGSYGHLLVVAGSLGMAGAAAYAAGAALRSGVGLASVACPLSIATVLQTLLPSAMCVPLAEKNGAVAPEAVPVLSEALRGKSAVVVGPGLSRRAAPQVVEAVLKSELPAVLDADALNLMAERDELKRLLTARHVITPHPGEAARLCPECDGLDPLEDARLLRGLGAVSLLKGASTIVVGERIHVSASGSPGMATGGSGDVLSGILGALLAQGVDPEDAAWCASEIHGRCGERAADRLGETAMNAADLIDELPGVFKELSGR